MELLAAGVGAGEGGLLGAASIEGLLEALLAASGPGRVFLPTSLVPRWSPRMEALGRPWVNLHLEGAGALDTLMTAVERAEPGDQVWLNLDRGLGPMDLHSLEAFLPFAASRPHPPLVVLLRDDARSLARTQRLAVDRQGNVLLMREVGAAAYALGPPALLVRLARTGLAPAAAPLALPRVQGKGRLLALDVDGVLIDPGRSFLEAVAAALAELAPTLPWDDSRFAAFKRVGGFNNDFRLAAGAMALWETGSLARLEPAAGVGFPDLEARIQVLEPLCQVAVQKHYARTRRLERPLVGHPELQAFRGDVAIFTGRPPEELAMAFQVLRFRLPAVSDSAPHLRKPRPEGLLQLADAFRAEEVIFVGDTCDDATALRAARDLHPRIRWTFAGVGPERATFLREGDLQGSNLKEILSKLPGRSLS